MNWGRRKKNSGNRKGRDSNYDPSPAARRGGVKETLAEKEKRKVRRGKSVGAEKG